MMPLPNPTVRVPTLSEKSNNKSTTTSNGGPIAPYSLAAATAAAIYKRPNNNTSVHHSHSLKAVPTTTTTPSYAQRKTLMDYYFNEPYEVTKATTSTTNDTHNDVVTGKEVNAVEESGCAADRCLASADFVERLVQEMRQSCQLPCSPVDIGPHNTHNHPFMQNTNTGEEEADDDDARLLKSPTVPAIVLGRPTIDAFAQSQRGFTTQAFPFAGVHDALQQRRSRSPSPVPRRETAVSLSLSTVRAVSSAHSSPTRHTRTAQGTRCTSQSRHTTICTAQRASSATRRLQRSQTDTQLVMPHPLQQQQQQQQRRRHSSTHDNNECTGNTVTPRVHHPSWAPPPLPRHRLGWNQRRPPPQQVTTTTRSRPIVNAEVSNAHSAQRMEAAEREGRQGSRARLSRSTSLAHLHKPSTSPGVEQEDGSKEDASAAPVTENTQTTTTTAFVAETSPTRVLFPHTSDTAAPTAAEVKPNDASPQSPLTTTETMNTSNTMSPAALRVRLSELEHCVRVAVQRATSAEAHAARLEERLRAMQAAQAEERLRWMTQHGELTGQLGQILHVVQMLEQPLTTNNSSSSNTSNSEHQCDNIQERERSTGHTMKTSAASPLTPQEKPKAAAFGVKLNKTVPHTLDEQQEEQEEDTPTGAQGITPSPLQATRGSGCLTESSTLRAPPSPPMLLQLHVK